ncbi:MAG: hypothetical protein WC846_04950 [Candidatus Gracilibacteria bacterium]|jgi:hypothetical protein
MKFSKAILPVCFLLLAVVLTSCLKSNVYKFDNTIDPQGKYSFTYDDAVWQRNAENPITLELKSDTSCVIIPAAGGKGFEGPEYDMVRNGTTSLIYNKGKLERLFVDVGTDGDGLIVDLLVSQDAPEACTGAFAVFMSGAYPTISVQDMPYDEPKSEEMTEFTDDVYGLSFEYPSKWIFDNRGVNDNGVTEIGIKNVEVPDGSSCTEDVSTVGIFLGMKKDAGMPLLDFITSSERYQENGEGIGIFSGEITPDSFGGGVKDVYKVAGSGFESYCPNYAYLFELSDTTYGEIVVSLPDRETDSQKGLQKILDSMKF